MPKVMLEMEISEEQLKVLLNGSEPVEAEKPARRGRGRGASKDESNEEETSTRGRRGSRGPTKTSVKAIASQVKSDCPKGTLDDILAEFKVDSIDDLPKGDYQDFIDECNKDIQSA